MDFDQLYKEQFPVVYRYLTGLCGNQALAEELTQETFCRAIEHSASLYYKVVVFKAPLQGLCYTVRDAVDWLGSPTTRWFQKGSNHSPLQFC